MAQLMSDSDLTIGAAGATSWERCCLGLPSILFVLADNQIQIASALSYAGAIIKLELSNLAYGLPNTLTSHINHQVLFEMSSAASQICTGEGAKLVSTQLMET